MDYCAGWGNRRNRDGTAPPVLKIHPWGEKRYQTPFSPRSLNGTNSALLPSDLLLDPTVPRVRSTNLKTPSALRLHKLATIHCSGLARFLGAVDSQTQSVVASKLSELLQL